MFETVNTAGHTLYGGKYWEDLTLSEKWNYYRYNYGSKLGPNIVGWFVDRCIIEDDINTLMLVFDYLNVPDNLTLKERISYYELLGN